MIIERTPPRIANGYESLYRSWREARLQNIKSYREKILVDTELLMLKKGDRVLDVGCAFGFDLMELSDMGFDCEGIEITKDFAEIADILSQHFKLETKVNIGDACDLPYEDETFDAVMSTEFFSHVSDCRKAMDEQVRVLKRGGRLLIRDGNILCPVNVCNLVFVWPVRTKGKYGGMKWIRTRKKVVRNYDGRGFDGKTEDIKSLFWWRRFLRSYKNLEIELATTGFARRHRAIPKLMAPFIGSIVIVARKK